MQPTSQFNSDYSSHKASAPRAQQLSLTSSTTLLRPCSLRVRSTQTIQPTSRGGKIGLTRWASPVRLELGLGWAGPLNYWPEKNRAKFGPTQYGQARYGPARPGPIEYCFALKRLFDPTSPVFRVGWVVKILARKDWVNFGPARFWPDPLLARPGPAQPGPACPIATSTHKASAPGAQQLSLTSSTTLLRPCILRVRSAQAIQPIRHQHPEPSSLV